jgi:hypothetical protein
MLTGIRVGNFKAFADTQRVPIRPVTLVYGANSSGKSSVLHSLIFARHAEETGELDVHRTGIGGESVDLGGFSQFVHRRDLSRRIEWGADLDTASFTGRLAELLAPVKRVTASATIGIALDDRGRPAPGAAPEVQAYELLGDDRTILRMSLRPDGTLQLDRLEHEHPLFRQVIRAIVETSTTTESLSPDDFEDLAEAIGEVVPEVAAPRGKFFPGQLTKAEQYRGAAGLLFPISRGRRKEDLAAALRFFLPRAIDDLLRGIQEAMQGEMARLQYLGPLRSYPPRHLAFSQHHDPNWRAGGGYAWDVVRRDEGVRKRVNAWLMAPDRLQTPYELTTRALFSWEQVGALWEEFAAKSSQDQVGTFIKKGLHEELMSWLYGAVGEAERDPEAWQELTKNLAERVFDPSEAAKEFSGVWLAAVSDPIYDLVLVDRRSNTAVSHRDIGIGISQVLPVLVSAFASSSQIITIEQPEIHLHPALQADLGDVFLQAALGEQKNRFLIESHSEHLLLRIMRRMRETANGSLPQGVPPVRPEDVAVLFVQPKGSSAAVRHLELDEEGQLLDPWPGGFFEEGYRERFA